MDRMLRAVDRGLTSGLRELPAVRGKAHVALAWKSARERRGPLDGAWTLQLHDGSIVSLPLASTMTWTLACAGEWDSSPIDLVSRVRMSGVRLDI